ncbi:MAG: hypothetical protein C0453_05170 [Comamonadaceae bacterium]|nr:hypothetical protein [Comamonadaceae bacterium]
MMRHATNHQPLFARQPTFAKRSFASANDCLMPVTVNTAAEHGGQQCCKNAIRKPTLDARNGSHVQRQ